MRETEYKTISISIYKRQYDKLKDLPRGVNISSVVRDFLEDYLK